MNKGTAIRVSFVNIPNILFGKTLINTDEMSEGAKRIANRKNYYAWRGKKYWDTKKSV